MQTINFSPLEFQNFRQQEADARRRQYGSFSDMFNTIGNTAEKMGAAQQRYDDAQKAEEWRQKQWNHQRWQEEDERKRREEQERLDRESAERLRSDFLGSIGQEDIGQYGPGAAFALSQIRHGRNYQDVSQGGSNLNNIIFQQRMLDAQRAERERERVEQEEESIVPNFINEYDTKMARDIGYDFNKPEDFPSRLKKNDLENTKYRMIKEISYLETLMDSDPRYRTRRVVNRLNALKTSLTGIDMRMNPRGYTKF